MTKLTKSRAAVRPSNLLATVTAIVVVVGVFSSAQATTIYVDDDNCPGPGDGSEGNPYCSIQTAIDNAVDTDEIVVAPGTYDEAINFMGKAVWLHSSDGPDVTIIFGGVTCDSGEGSESVLQGLTVTGGYGGGMRNIGTSPSVINCRFEDNGSFDDGGGMFNSGANPTIVDSTFARNAAWGPWKTPGGNGGGMYNVDSNPVIVNCLFEENHASYGGDGGGGGGGDGGGMYNVNSSPTLINCTFHGNSADEDGGGMYSANSSPTVTNCIFWANGIAGSSGSSVVTYSIVQGGYPGTGNINVDPMFVDPDNGDFGLLPGSPCIDAGDNTAVPEGITTDLDGNPRFVDDPGLCDFGHTDGDNPVVDIGAFEFQGVSPLVDCNGNGEADTCDIVDGNSLDCDANVVPDECDPDCNENGVPDDCDIDDGTSLDCNGNQLPDECDIADGTSTDCNGNGVPDECDDPDCNENSVPDECDIDDGTSLDCNGNGVPDECDDPDCNENSVPDECDIDDGTSLDCNGNGVPDECDTDCNENGVPDECDIDDGTSLDCNGNGVPDECDTDCNENGNPDECDIADGTSTDYNGNGIPDSCECLGDFNGNGEVEDLDFQWLLLEWGWGWKSDINSDGTVNVLDFLILLRLWGPCF